MSLSHETRKNKSNFHTKNGFQPPLIENIPAGLRNGKRWVLWRLEETERGLTKVPYQINNHKAASNAPWEWTTFDRCVSRFQEHNGYMSGIGRMIENNENLVGVDFDKCVVDGEISEAVMSVLRLLNTYCEISPSGTGIRAFLYAQHPDCGVKDEDQVYYMKHNGFEVYYRTRFLTTTGRHIEGFPLDVQPRQEELIKFLNRYMVRPVHERTHNNPNQPTDVLLESGITVDLIVRKAMAAKNGAKFKKLWNGDISDYGDDPSRADLALCEMLAFWCPNPEDIDAVFSQSKLCREKWFRTDYRRRTISKALSGQKEFFDWTDYKSDKDFDSLFERKADGESLTSQSNGEHHCEKVSQSHNGEISQSDSHCERSSQSIIKPNAKCYSLADWYTKPMPRYLVKELVNLNTITFVAGLDQTYKTFFGLDIAASVATDGHEVLGTFKTKTGPVLYLCGESPDGINLRAGAWQQYHGITVPNLIVTSCRWDFASDDSTNDFIKWVEETFTEKPILLVVDTFSKYNGDENDSSKILANFRRIIERWKDHAILALHHFGKDKERGMRGDSRQQRDTDHVIIMERNITDPMITKVTCVKNKEKGHWHSFNIEMVLIKELFHPISGEVITDEDGEPYTSLVATMSKRTPADIKEEERNKTQDETFAKLLRLLPTPDDDPKAIKDIQDDAGLIGFKKSSVATILNLLHAERLVDKTQDESSGGRKPFLYRQSNKGADWLLRWSVTH